MELNKLKSFFIYINNENEIIQIKELDLPLSNHENDKYISKMDLIYHIHNMKKDEISNYILKNIGLHHVIVNNNNVQDYIHDNDISFFNEINYFSDIILKSTNPIFFELSSLYIIFKQKSITRNNNTKKINFNVKKVNKKKSLKQKF